jgi:replicative DNA helicase
MTLSTPIHVLKHRARQLSRREGIPLHRALDQTARAQGYASWGLLAARWVASTARDASARPSAVEEGDLVLVGARPGHGKTRLCLEWLASELASGEWCAIYSFELTRSALERRFAELGVDPLDHPGRLHFDDSDAICAERIITQMAHARPGTWILVDYLQLLDQRRVNPDLQEQIEQLGAFAARQRVKVLVISQIDKAFDDSRHAMPTLEDVRLPNPLDLRLFTRSVFIHDGRVSSARMT